MHIGCILLQLVTIAVLAGNLYCRHLLMPTIAVVLIAKRLTTSLLLIVIPELVLVNAEPFQIKFRYHTDVVEE